MRGEGISKSTMEKQLHDAAGRFRKNYYALNQELYAELAAGQKPHTLFITCSDSRVIPTTICESLPGELFVVQNVANMVPAWDKVESHSAISSPIEYAVQVLEVSTIIVCGHSACGGCKLLHDLGTDKLAGEKLPLTSLWVETSSEVRSLMHTFNEGNISLAVEQANVYCQVNRLQNYPFIVELASNIQVYGWYYDILSGCISQYNATTNKFEAINNGGFLRTYY